MKNKKRIIGKITTFILSLTMVGAFPISSMAIEEYVPNDTLYSETKWAQDMMNVPKVWEQGYFGQRGTNSADAPVVAIIDSGIMGSGVNPNKSKHEDLNYANILTGKNFVKDSKTSIVNSTYTDDIDGHGTRIAGIIAAKHNNEKGIAGDMPNVKIKPYRCVENSEGGELNDLIACVNQAVADNVDVINISIIGGGGGPGMRNAIEAANAKGIIVCVAVGNDGDDSVNYPSGYEGVIGVGSVGNSGKKSGFSNYNDYVDVVAPGENIKGPSNASADAYGSGNGTSFACPHVSALAAMCKSIDPSINHNKFLELLKGTSWDVGTASYDTSYGYGIVDYKAMLDAILPADNSIWRASITGISNQEYTGNDITFKNLKITMPDGKELSAGSDYKVTYKNNRNAGTGMLVISGEGAYTGKINKYFTILKPKDNGGSSSGGGSGQLSNNNQNNQNNQKPVESAEPNPIRVEPTPFEVEKTSIKRLVPGRKSFMIKWKKVSDADGYKLQYSTTKSFKKGTYKKITINNKRTTYKVKKLKPNKKYYVRIRSYRIVNGKKQYSKWSGIKSGIVK